MGSRLVLFLALGGLLAVAMALPAVVVEGDGDDGVLAVHFNSTNATVEGTWIVPDALENAHRTAIKAAAMALYNNRNSEHYTQGASRWDGIDHKIRPPHAPKYSDCSSAATWAYWTVFGSGPDFLNGESWKAGYTGTMRNHGKKVSLSNALHGDLVFYGPKPEHVAIYVGDGKVVSHGGDPVGLYSVHYRSDLQEVRSYI